VAAHSFSWLTGLGIIQDGLRFQSTTADSSPGEFVQLKLCAHFLNLRRLLFQFFFESLHFLLLLCDDRSLVLHCAMLFKELIEQHRVYCFIGHRVGLAALVANHQIWVHFFNFLGNETELRSALRVDLFFVMERDWFEREDRLTLAIHRFNLLLETLGTGCYSKLTAAIDYNCCSCNWYAADTGDKSLCLDITDADRSRVASDAYQVANIDIVIALSNKDSRPCTQGDIAVASEIALERIRTDGCIVDTGGVDRERGVPDDGVGIASGVILKRAIANSRVEIAVRVAKEGERSISRVSFPVVLFKSAPAPVAVLLSATLNTSVPAPTAALNLPSLSLASEFQPRAVL